MSVAQTFFSYSRSDAEFALKLATDLREAGADVWLDQLDILPGLRWDSEIEKALQASENILVILSPKAVASNNVMDEISYALEEGKRVIPILISECSLPFRIKRLQHIDFTQNYDQGCNRLLTALSLEKKAKNAEQKLLNTDTSLKELSENQEETLWKRAEQENSLMAYEGYLKEYRQGKYKDNALSAIKNLDTQNDKKEKEETLWRKACNDDDIASYKIYLKQTKLGLHIEEAKGYIEEIEKKDNEKRDELLWQQAEQENSIYSYRDYLKDFPEGAYKDKAISAIKILEAVTEQKQKNETEETLWRKACNDNDIASYQIYLKETELGFHSEEARRYIEKIEKNQKQNQEELLWQKTNQENSINSYEDYLNEYPQGEHAKKAAAEIKNLKALIEEDLLWKNALKNNTLASYTFYFKQTQLGKHKEEAESFIKKIEEQNEKDEARSEITTEYSGKPITKAVELLEEKFWKQTSVISRFLKSIPKWVYITISSILILLFLLFLWTVYEREYGESSYTAFSQNQNFEALLDSGKAEYKREISKQEPNFKNAYGYLQKAVQLNPKSTEARYFFGYTIDKMNSASGESLIYSSEDLSKKASEQFEYVIKEEPQYKGEILALDPYSKISTIWGALGLAYLNQRKIDSAKWAFSEGKKRGGFLEPMLHYSRQLLSSCDEASILVTYGDIVIFPIYYLQLLEQDRKDIIPVDASLLHSVWYPKFLKSYNGLSISYSNREIDTLDYQQWKSTEIKITNPKDNSNSLKWILKPTYGEHYILKGDKILLDILKQNYFKKEIYFTSPTDSSFNLFLEPHMLKKGIVEKVVSKINTSDDLLDLSNSFTSFSIIDLDRSEIQNSRDVIKLLNGLRFAYLSRISFFITHQSNEEAKKLFLEMEEKLSIDKLPFPSDEIKEYYASIKSAVYN